MNTRISDPLGESIEQTFANQQREEMWERHHQLMLKNPFNWTQTRATSHFMRDNPLTTEKSKQWQLEHVLLLYTHVPPWCPVGPTSFEAIGRYLHFCEKPLTEPEVISLIIEACRTTNINERYFPQSYRDRILRHLIVEIASVKAEERSREKHASYLEALRKIGLRKNPTR